MEDCAEALRRLAEQCVSSKLDAQKGTSQGLLKLLELKEESRKLAFAAEDQREETSKFKTRLEHAHLQLQNLIYEKEYYEKEIHECQNFRFKHPDSAIGLVPVEQFLASAGPEVLERIGDDPHKLMLERLRDELSQRKAMVAKLEELKKAKAATRQEVDKRKRTLDDLQQQLQGLEETAKPLQSILAPHLSLRGFARSADLLPLPLYIVYSQLAAVREALGLPIRVAILGSSVEAESFAKAQTADPADAADGAAAPEPASKQARLSPAPGQAGATASGEDLYKVHPLSVLLEVQRDNNGRLQTIISVKFQFLVNLKLVTAHSEVRDDNVLLAALFPGDDGSATAYESLAQLQGGTFKYDTSRPAKPYRWCQHLAGLDFAPPLPLATQLPAAAGGAGAGGQAESAGAVMEGLESYRRQQRVIHVIERLRSVKTGDEAAKKIIAALEKQPNPPNMARYPKLPVTVVFSVEEIKSAAPAAGGAGVAGGASKNKDSVARVAAALGARPGAGNGPGGSKNDAAPASALPLHMRGDAAEDGEVGLRGSRNATPAVDGRASPVPMDVSGPGGAANGLGAGGRTASELGLSASAVAATAGGKDGSGVGGGGGDVAMEDGEAAAEGEEGGRKRRANGDEGEGDEEGREDGEEQGEDGNAADQLVSRYLLTDLLAAEAAAGGTGGGGGPPKPAAPKPVSRLYRIVLRHKERSLECELLVRLFLEYPLRPPLLLVKGVRELPRERRGQPRPINNVNLVSWLESEANSAALAQVPADAPNTALLYQLLHLRLAFDEFANAYAAEGGGGPSTATATTVAAVAAAAAAAAAATGEDLMALLASKQRMRGRDRRVVLPVLGDSPVPPAVLTPLA